MLSAYEQKKYAMDTFCNLSRAFECIYHGVLMYKLDFYSVCGEAIQLFKYYLGDRKQTMYT